MTLSSSRWARFTGQASNIALLHEARPERHVLFVHDVVLIPKYPLIPPAEPHLLQWFIVITRGDPNEKDADNNEEFVAEHGDGWDVRNVKCQAIFVWGCGLITQKYGRCGRGWMETGFASEICTR